MEIFAAGMTQAVLQILCLISASSASLSIEVAVKLVVWMIEPYGGEPPGVRRRCGDEVN